MSTSKIISHTIKKNLSVGLMLCLIGVRKPFNKLMAASFTIV